MSRDTFKAKGNNKTMWLVWNQNHTECVGFDNQDDAEATAEGGRFEMPAIGDNFREMYADDEEEYVFDITTVEVP